MAQGLRPAPSADRASDRRRRGVAMRLGVAAAAVAIIWVIAPEAVRATVSGPGPFLGVAAVFAAFAVWSLLLDRSVHDRRVRTALVAVPAVAVTWWALTPYVVDDVVDDAFPVAVGAEQGTVSSTPSLPHGAPASETPAPDTPTTDAPTTETPTTETPAPAAPVATHRGSFQGLTGHRGSGTATVHDLGDGTRVLRLEDFDVSNGPGLELHLVPGADRRDPGGGVEIADLKGNVGNQNYDVPADLALDGPWTVLIWCEPFRVEVANATLGAV